MDEQPENHSQIGQNDPVLTVPPIPTAGVAEKKGKDPVAIGLWMTVLVLFGLIIGLTISEKSTVKSKEKRSKLKISTEASAYTTQMQTTMMLKEWQKTLETGSKTSKTNADTAGYLSIIKDEKDPIVKELLTISAIRGTGGTLTVADSDALLGSKIKELNAIGKLAADPNFDFGSREVFIKEARKSGPPAELAAVILTAPKSEKTPIISHYGWGAMMSKLLAGGMLVFLVGIGVVSWIVYFANRKNWPPLGHPVRVATDRQSAYLGLMAFGLLFFFQVFISLGSAAGSAKSLASPTVAIAGLVFALGTLVALTHIKFGDQNLFQSLFKSSPISIGKQILWGFCGACANLIVVFLTIAITMPLIKDQNASHPIQEEFVKGLTPGTFLLLWIMAAIVAPIWEEIAFRGFLASGITKITGRIPIGIIGSSFIFAAIHPQGPALWLGLGMVGAMACMLTYQTKSQLPGIIMHCVHNSTLLIMAYAYAT